MSHQLSAGRLSRSTILSAFAAGLVLAALSCFVGGSQVAAGPGVPRVELAAGMPSRAMAAPDGSTVLFSSGFETGTLAGFASSGMPGWVVTSTFKIAGNYSAHAPGYPSISNQTLTSTGAWAVSAVATQATLTFWQRYAFDSGVCVYYDGAVLEISTDNGATWADAGANITVGGYGGTISNATGNPLAGRQGWVGSTKGAFTKVTVNMLPYKGKSIKLRFRFGSDATDASSGWWIDDITISQTTPDPATATRTATATTGTLPCQNVVWAAPVNVTIAGNTITKTGTTGWTGGAASSQSITSGNGYVQATIVSAATNLMFGLSNGNPGVTYQEIDFAFYTVPGNPTQLRVYENGVNRGTKGNYTVGDVLKVAVEGGVVKYYRNNALLYTSTVAPVYPLLLDSSLYQVGARVQNAIICGTNISTVIPPTATRTATRTNTAAVTATRTAVPPTRTATRTASASRTATRTNTAAPTATSTITPVPPTSTYTRTPVPATRTYTRTPIPATGTHTRTATSTIAASMTLTPRPMNTISATPTPTATRPVPPNGCVVNLAAAANGGLIVGSSSSAGSGYEATHLIDANTIGTWWTASGQTTNQWAIVELGGGTTAINRVRIAPQPYSGNPSWGLNNFEIRISTTTADAAAFTTILSGATTQQPLYQEFMFAPVQAKYVMLFARNNYGGSVLNIAELEVYAATSCSCSINYAGAGNGGQVAGSSSNYGSSWDAKYAIDGSPDLYWSTNYGASRDQWLTIDLAGDTRLINKVRINPHGSNGYDDLRDFEIRVSTTTTDTAAFSTVFRGMTPNQPAFFEFSFPPVQAKYVQLYGLNTHSSGTFGPLTVAEFEVYYCGP